MLDYFLKSGACLAILLLFYKLFLERESIHVFKRYYLLGALLVSFVIPFIVFTEYVEVAAVNEMFVSPTQPIQAVGGAQVQPIGDAAMVNIPLLLWTIYGLGVFLFGFKFIKNLGRIIQRIRKNPKYRVNTITQVLLNDLLAPHTFFSYVFLNKEKYEKREIPEAVLLHEETHAKQKHSLDVLLVEVLQVVFWFNPLLYFTKSAIKLNHEFLADQAVVNHGVETAAYQNLLLAFSSNVAIPQFSNSINYSSIKKRFTVMKKRTSKKSVLLRSLLLLPLLAMLLYGFSETKIVEKAPNQTDIVSQKSITKDGEKENLTVKISRAGILFKEKKVSIPELKNSVKQALINSKNNGISITIVEEVPSRSKVAYLAKFFEIHNIPIQVIKFVNSASPEQAKEGKRPVLIINITKDGELLINGERVSFARADAYLAKTIKQENSVRAKIIPDGQTPKDIVSEIERILDKYNVAQIDIVGPLESYTPISTQEGATKKQLSEYNALAKKYNRQISKEKSIMIYKSDVERLEYLHGLMTHEQRENAQPFPDFPEPPPPPRAPKAPTTLTEREEAAVLIEEIIEEQDPYDVVTTFSYSAPNSSPSSNSNHIYLKQIDNIKRAQFQKEEASIVEQEKLVHIEEAKLIEQEEKMLEQEAKMEKQEIKLAEDETLIKEKESRMEEQEILMEEQEAKMRERQIELKEIEEEVERGRQEPPTPPTPKSPLDHLIEMAKKGATFYYKGKEISSDQAIEILKKNKDINIESRTDKGKKPVVKLSTEPIVLEN